MTVCALLDGVKSVLILWVPSSTPVPWKRGVVQHGREKPLRRRLVLLCPSGPCGRRCEWSTGNRAVYSPANVNTAVTSKWTPEWQVLMARQ